MNRHSIFGWVTVILTISAVTSVTAPAKAATPEEVQKAIENGQKFLLSQQGNAIPGTWERAASPTANGDAGRIAFNGRQWGGLTSIATYALLASGADVRDKEIRKSVDWLMRANIESTYGLGLSSQIVLPEFGIPRSDQALNLFIKRDVLMLRLGLIWPPQGSKSPQGWKSNVGFYGYWTGTSNGTAYPQMNLNPQQLAKYTHQPGDWFDRSNSQYGVLGMWALAQAGGEVPQAYWEVVDAAWKKAQHHDGSWNYNPENEQAGSPSMTAAGVATLFITQDFLLPDNWSNCRGGVKNEYIERGLAWMDRNIDKALNSGPYTLYGIERIGAASGRKSFGTIDWYQRGAELLVKNQKPDGSWNLGGYPGSEPLTDTCYALLFLARGRAPVFMNKLEYASAKTERSIPDPWNERPRDVANLARWAGVEREAFFNWQVVNLKGSPEELHDSPILYISGSQALDFNKEQIDKLRTFCEEGGIILGNADCGKEAFTKSFIALGRQLFPKYEFKQATPTDLLYNEQFTKFRPKPKVMQLTNEVRKLMVLLPELDGSHWWQVRADKTHEAAFELGQNLYLYAVGGKDVDKTRFPVKGQTYIVMPDPAAHPAKTLDVARLELGLNPDPEPAGWKRLAAIMHNRFNTELKPTLVKIDQLSKYKVAHLTGTSQLSLTSSQREALKTFLQGGGTLIVDAAGGDAAFAGSAENELNNLLGNKLAALPKTHPIYNQPNLKIGEITWRDFAITRIVNRKEPKLQGIDVNGRTAVFFSREDLSEGLVGQPVDGILGYSPQTASDLMAAMLMCSSPGAGSVPAAASIDQPAK